jgi:hypothetical protein
MVTAHRQSPLGGGLQLMPALHLAEIGTSIVCGASAEWLYAQSTCAKKVEGCWPTVCLPHCATGVDPIRFQAWCATNPKSPSGRESSAGSLLKLKGA